MHHLLRGFLIAATCVLASAVAAEPRPLFISDVTVIDGTGAPPRAHQDVLIERGKIAAITAHGRRGRSGAKRIDGAGKFLLPGLIDVHVHIVGGAFRRGRDLEKSTPNDDLSGIRALQGYLYAGFTTVYDAGNDGPYIFGLRQRQRAGAFAGPRLLASGFYLTAPNGRGNRGGDARIGIALQDGPAGVKTLDDQLARAPDIQKVTYEGAVANSLSKETMRQAVAYLLAHGMRTTVHISTEATARDAIDVGVDSLAHTPTGGVLTDAFVKMAADRQIPIATTMSVFDDIIRLGEGTAFLREPMYTALIEPEELDDRAASRDRYNSLGWTKSFALMMPALKQNIKALNDAGAVLALGTDKSFAPLALREMQLLSETGIPPLHIIKIATLNAARFLNRADDLGTIAPGKVADLVLLSADPSRDIMNVQAVEAVIQGGSVIDRKKLDVPINRKR